jgi:uncharacterized protein YxjI
MHPALNKNLFFIKEQVKMFKAANSFDIFDPETKEQILQCTEENLGTFTKIFRFTDYKRMTPFNMHVKDMNGNTLFTVKRGVSFFLSSVQVLDGNGILVGQFKQKFFSIGGKFEVLDASERCVCCVENGQAGNLSSYRTMEKILQRLLKNGVAWAKNFSPPLIITC